DRRIDVAAADVADRVDGGEDREREGERDRGQAGRTVDAGPAGARRQEHGQRHGARADEHQDGGAEDLGGELLELGRGRHVLPPLAVCAAGQSADVTYGASSAARAARASSASGPSAASVIADDGRIVRPRRAMRLFASASRPSSRMTIRLENRLAAWTNLAAGRAW